MEALLTPFVWLAGLGLVLSLVVHACAVMGLANPFGAIALVLHAGVFVVWFPAVVVAHRSTQESKHRDFWKAALRGCPEWMKRMAYAFGAYAMINFVLFLALFRNNELRGFSGHWMAFYSAALAGLYSARQMNLSPERCPVGHLVSPFAKYCEECGNAIQRVPQVPRT
jgi:hypothetical protein